MYVEMQFSEDPFFLLCVLKTINSIVYSVIANSRFEKCLQFITVYWIVWGCDWQFDFFITRRLCMLKSQSGGHKDGKSSFTTVIGSAPLMLPLTSVFITTSFELDYCACRWCLFNVCADVCRRFADTCNICAACSPVMHWPHSPFSLF